MPQVAQTTRPRQPKQQGSPGFFSWDTMKNIAMIAVPAALGGVAGQWALSGLLPEAGALVGGTVGATAGQQAAAPAQPPPQSSLRKAANVGLSRAAGSAAQGTANAFMEGYLRPEVERRQAAQGPPRADVMPNLRQFYSTNLQ